ncbi:uncharacterized protein DUF3108 [Bradyrhizobium macuxiense]|uniref:Uncharacterized protein DUF3108 n=1 Tax=Bradyrhizobium macuxiense TaxID=1755647 RepID=A0A560M0V7_9BRAD|nr:uncharacterized protein DUF3108 [Bradyrhizobium macuxiense]
MTTAIAILPPLGRLLGLCAGALLLFCAERASAQGRLDAQYEATLAGIPVGKGSWTIEIGDDSFSAAAQGGTAGLLKAFSGGTGAGASQGRVVNGSLVASSYTATTTTSKKSETIRMVLANGGIKESAIEPEPPVDADRLPVTEAQKKNVFDPMTGSFLRAPGNAELMSPDVCRTGAGVFDGRMRYDLKLDFKRVEIVKAERGYHGPALVCALYFVPISGYIPDRPVIKYLAAQRNIEIAFVPIAGTRLLVPFRMTIPTPLGQAMLEATSFVTTAAPPRVAKTQ